MMLFATVLALVRVFVLGIAAASLGMIERGGVSSALLRIFQLYNLFFVYILLLQYLKSESKAFLKIPTIVIASVSPVLSILAFVEFIASPETAFSMSLAGSSGAILAVILLDIAILAFIAFDASKPQTPLKEGSDKASENSFVEVH
jgi:hypothetical protein